MERNNVNLCYTFFGQYGSLEILKFGNAKYPAFIKRAHFFLILYKECIHSMLGTYMQKEDNLVEMLTESNYYTCIPWCNILNQYIAL